MNVVGQEKNFFLRWNPEFQSDGLKYFAQRINEMLFHYSDSVYKVPVLNTYYLIKEYLDIAKLVKRGIIKEIHLQYVLNELIDSFGKDVILKERIGIEAINYYIDKLNTSNGSKQEELIQYLFQVFSDYNEWCKSYLLSVVPHENWKKKIESGLRCFIPGLINAGYSPEFIYYYNRKVFFDSNVEGFDALEAFLNRFDYKKQSYTVYIPIDKEAKTFKDILSSRLNFTFTDEELDELKYDKEKYELVKTRIDAFDKPSASNEAYESLYLFFRYYNFFSNASYCWYGPKCIVVSDSKSSKLDFGSSGFKLSSVKNPELLGSVAENVISLLLNKAWRSFETIDKAIQRYNAALESSNLENGFLNLWSILEILFVSDSYESKLAEIRETLIPIIQFRYLTNQFSSLKEYIITFLDEEVVDTIIAECGSLEAFVILDEYENNRKELFALIPNNPLLRSRISQMHDLYRKKEGIRSDIDRYTERVTWHLMRLYRTRNLIIHSGTIPLQLRYLGEHLYDYVELALSEVLFSFSKNQNYLFLSNVLIDIKMRNDRFNKLIASNNAISKAELERLVSLIKNE